MSRLSSYRSGIRRPPKPALQASLSPPAQIEKSLRRRVQDRSVASDRRFELAARLVRFGVLLSFLLIAASATATDHPDPKTLVETTIETLREHVNREQQRIKKDPRIVMDLIERLVAPHVDLRLAGKLALGVHWRDAQPRQRDAFVAAIRGLLLRIFALHINDYRDAVVTYLPTKFRGDENQLAMVRTSVSRQGFPPVRVDYRMYRSADDWKVFDVSVIGISIVKTYRITIEYDLRTRGLDAIIDQINAQSPLPKNPALSDHESPPQ